jgi:hypothetical protein
MAAEDYFDAERENSVERMPSFAADEVAEVRDLPDDPLDWEYVEFRRAQVLLPETSLRNPTPVKIKSIHDLDNQIPAIWKEELLCEEHDHSVSVAILESYGPITLLVYNRCIDLASQYIEMKELRSLFLTAATCTRRFRIKEERPNSTPDCLRTPVREDRSNKFVQKIMDFFIFNLKMSKLDI